ncbi:exodeoxyribonuclease VII small subunit [Fimbriiglobus ruber]|uniref:Exodeoxyribonuclease 7 small subunit n=1 Tax=Fimbriiglobus ruber TaxID=1908690 RepID=A0A225DVA6_9BACT|nr:exodeoxyribonuclease VII small subunit [Fimbriiglobus ruber]OWK45292.1 Exodeoxyribonuclease VII small subunit [Fimbriiglobus ruber]
MPDQEPKLRFEQALGELERILRDLEDGTTTLEDALARYERGVGLLKQCYAQLRDAEQKIRQLSGLTEDGKPELKPFEHTAAVEKSKPPARRPKPPEPPPENGDEAPF